MKFAIVFIFSLFFTLLFSRNLSGQPTSNEFLITKILTDTHHLYHITLPEPSIGAAIKISSGDLNTAYFINGREKYFLQKNEESTTPQAIISNLFFFKSATAELDFYSGNISDTIEIHTFYSSKISLPSNSTKLGEVGCLPPTSIPPSIWRVGLPPPKQRPDSTKVEHIIIHHSATDVSNTDYTAAVRSIYMYHTQTNGWDDLGYNFLISPDGTIFQGRDDWGLYQKDNVVGAHYCGKNTNTMGICLLGNFMKYSPSDASIASLIQLTSWKLEKENLAAGGSSIHPRTGSVLLPNIAGHRDNCSTGTECPGNNLYSRLSEIRNSAEAEKGQCESNTSKILIYPVPTDAFLYFKNLEGSVRAKIVDVQGKSVHEAWIEKNELYVNFLPAGFYFLQLHVESETKLFKFLKY